MPEGSDVQWVKIRGEGPDHKPHLSWHVFDSPAVDEAGQPFAELVRTSCRRLASASTLVDSVPGGGKTCESCLRRIVR